MRRRDFPRLGAGAAGHGFGSNGEQVVVGMLVFEITGSSSWVGLSLALYYGPMLFVGAPAGLLADWLDRRRLLPLVEILEAAVLVAFAVLAWLDRASLAALLALTLVSGSVRAAHHPARLGYAYDLEGPDRVVSALGRLNVVIRAGQLAGSLLAGVVTERVGAGAAFALLAAVHLAGAGALAGLRTPGRGTQGAGSAWEPAREYLREVRRNATLRALALAVCAVEVLGYSYLTVLPELASTRLGLGAEGLGLLHGLRSVGGLAASLALARAAPRRLGRTYLLVMAGFGLAAALLGLGESLWLVAGAVVAVAALAATSDVLAQSMMQLCVPDRLRGRAMGMWVIAVGTGPAGHLEIGALAAAFGAGAALVGNGALLVAVALAVGLASPRVRGL